MCNEINSDGVCVRSSFNSALIVNLGVMKSERILQGGMTDTKLFFKVCVLSLTGLCSGGVYW